MGSTNKDSYKKWHDDIKKSELKHRTCNVFSKKEEFEEILRQSDSNDLCDCGRSKRSHTFEGDLNQDTNHQWNFDTNTILSKDIKTFGILYNPYEQCLTKFIRCDFKSSIDEIYRLIQDDRIQKPSLIISIYGGAKYFQMNERLQKEFMRGIVQVATSADGWILTTGLNSGVAKLVGQAILQDTILQERNHNNVISIGFLKWGTLTKSTRDFLIHKSTNQKNGLFYDIHEETYYFPEEILETNEPETIESHHKYLILLDDGQLKDYLGDNQRTKFVQRVSNSDSICYAITIILDGGKNTLQVILNDLKENRPVLFIQGSGRMANVLSYFIYENPYSVPQRDQIEKKLKEEFQSIKTDSEGIFQESDYKESSIQIKKILDLSKRHLLNVYSLDHSFNIDETIFNAIFKGYQNKSSDEQISQENIRNLLDLSIKWNSLEGVKQLIRDIKGETNQICEEMTQRFLVSMKSEKVMLVDCFLRCEYDVLKELKKNDILELYQYSWKKSHAKEYLFSTLDEKDQNEPTSMRIVDLLCEEFIGLFVEPLYFKESGKKRKRLLNNLTNLFNSFIKRICRCCWKSNSNKYFYGLIHRIDFNRNYSQQEKLRDLFLWSLFLGHVQLAKIILFYLKPRICAALIASRIFQQFSIKTNIIQYKQKMKNIADDFELYAVNSIDIAYQFNERKACELILREIPLFGHVSCVQVAIAAKSKRFLLTACFDRVMNEAWYDKLDQINRNDIEKAMIVAGLISFGILAPFYVIYKNSQQDYSNIELNDQFHSYGINSFMSSEHSTNLTWNSYKKRFLSFHQCPMIKMTYDFICNLMLLLIYSYMMLYHFDSPEKEIYPHWTQIYVIITITTMLIEHLRQKYNSFSTNTREYEHDLESLSLLLTEKLFTFALYALFYIGILMKFTLGNTPHLLTTARILVAFNLELWYLRTLRFIIAHEYLGPKLLMIKTMIRDLTVFLYIIFICTTAYGVVSRSLLMYNNITFSLYGIYSEIFYPPYLFLFGENDNEVFKEILTKNNGSYVAETTATQILFSFHMLFISVLLLNLLIAVFNFTINKVQDNTSFYWQYQRYLLIREYFQKPLFSYPPLTLFRFLWDILVYFLSKLINLCRKKEDNDLIEKKKGNVFKLIPKDKKLMGYRWDSFENTSTKSYARSIIQNASNSNSNSKNDSIEDQIHQLKSMIENLRLSSIKQI